MNAGEKVHLINRDGMVFNKANRLMFELTELEDDLVLVKSTASGYKFAARVIEYQSEYRLDRDILRCLKH